MHARVISYALATSAILAVYADAPQAGAQAEYRAQWLDAFHSGYGSASQVTATVANFRKANSNVIIPEVRVYSDAYYVPTASYYPDLGSSGGINSNGVQLTCDLNSDPEPQKYTGFDPLAEIIKQAHDTAAGARLEVWPWLVSFRATDTTGSGQLKNAHPTWVTYSSGGVAQTDFDPGHPGVEQQLYNVVMDLVNNYDIDGLNLDYIRFTSSSNGYNPVSVARFNAQTGRSGTPSNSDALWNQWRRDQVTHVLRKIYLNAIAVLPNLRVSADTIAYAPAPARPSASDPDPLSTWQKNFESTSGAYNSVYQDWRGWLEAGILDIAIPMAYMKKCSNEADYEGWNDFLKENQFDRQGMIGTGNYLNTLDDAIYQLKVTRNASIPGGDYATGQALYSYASPYAQTCGGTIVADPGAMSTYLSSGTTTDPKALYPSTVGLPTLPRPFNGMGHLKGTILDPGIPAPGWVDGAAVSIVGPVTRSAVADGTGFYGFIDLPPGSYSVTASAKGLPSVTKSVTVSARTVSTLDLPLVASSIDAIFDNASSAFQASAGWKTGRRGSGNYGDDYRSKSAEQVDDPATFTPALTNAGSYDVYAWWPHLLNAAKDTPFTVTGDQGSKVLSVNQRSTSGAWVLLGRFHFAAGSSGTIKVGANASSGTVLADAVRLVGPF